MATVMEAAEYPITHTPLVGFSFGVVCHCGKDPLKLLKMHLE